MSSGLTENGRVMSARGSICNISAEDVDNSLQKYENPRSIESCPKPIESYQEQEPVKLLHLMSKHTELID